MLDSGGGGGRAKPKPKKKANYKALQCFSDLLQRFAPKAHESVPGEIPGGGNQAEEAGVPPMPNMFNIPGPNGLPPEFGQQTSFRIPRPSTPAFPGFPQPFPNGGCYGEEELSRYLNTHATPNQGQWSIPIPNMEEPDLTPNGAPIERSGHTKYDALYEPTGLGEIPQEAMPENPDQLRAMLADPEYRDAIMQLLQEYRTQLANSKRIFGGLGRTRL